MNEKPDNERLGRSRIDDVPAQRTQSGTNRDIEVIRKGFKCSFCNHHKAIRNKFVIKCSRCKRKVE